MSEIEAKEYNALVELMRSVAESSNKAMERSEIALKECERMIDFHKELRKGVIEKVEELDALVESHKIPKKELNKIKCSFERDFREINTEINSVKEDLYLAQKRLSSIKEKPIHDIITTASGAIIALFCIFKIGMEFFK